MRVVRAPYRVLLPAAVLTMTIAIVFGLAISEPGEVSGSQHFVNVSEDAVQTFYQYGGVPHTLNTGVTTHEYDDQNSVFPIGVFYADNCKAGATLSWPSYTGPSVIGPWTWDNTYQVFVHLDDVPQSDPPPGFFTAHDRERLYDLTVSGLSVVLDLLPADELLNWSVLPNPWGGYLIETGMVHHAGTLNLPCPAGGHRPNVVEDMLEANFNVAITHIGPASQTVIPGSKLLVPNHPQPLINLRDSLIGTVPGAEDFQFIVDARKCCSPYQMQACPHTDPDPPRDQCLLKNISEDLLKGTGQPGQSGQGYGQRDEIIGWLQDDEPMLRAAINNGNCTNLQPAIDLLDKKYQVFDLLTDQAFFHVEGAREYFISHPESTCDPQMDWEHSVQVGDVAFYDHYLRLDDAPTTFPIAISMTEQTNAVSAEALTQIAGFPQPSRPSWATTNAINSPIFDGFPTPVQLRGSVWTAIVHGATGIFYFKMDNLIGRGFGPDNPSSYPENPGDTMSSQDIIKAGLLWDKAQEINGEIAALTDVLLQPTQTNYQVFIREGDVLDPRLGCPEECSPIHTMMKSSPDSNEHYIFAVNMDVDESNPGAPVDLQLHFAKGISSAEEYSDVDPVQPTWSSNILSDQLEPFEAKIYKITFETDPDKQPLGLYDVFFSPKPETYFHCKLAVESAGGSNLEGHAFCYIDNPLTDVNSEAYPTVRGDGVPGPWPPGEVPTEVYGDVDSITQLTGLRIGNTVALSGCIEDADESEPVFGNVIVQWIWPLGGAAGTANTWIKNSLSGCQDLIPDGDPPFLNKQLQIIKIAESPHLGHSLADTDLDPFPDTDFEAISVPLGRDIERSGDGVPDVRELGDDDKCGRRDPFNPYDYYDVSIPRDGVIDLPNDILGVILHFAPGGYPPGGENWDRPPVMAGAGLGSTWNRGAPDGVIDLPNDILGVILQFNPAGCPA